MPDIYSATAEKDDGDVNGGSTRMSLSPSELPFNGVPDHIEPGLVLEKTTVDFGQRLRRQRQRDAFIPKFFSSHGSFSYIRY